MKKFCVVLATVFAFNTGHGAAGPTNDELKIGTAQEFENLNPLIMTMAATTYMGYMVNREMVYLDSNGKWLPQLAKTIPTVENKMVKYTGAGEKRGLIANFEIIENAKWGDGTPVTCDAFKFAWEIGLNENVSIASRESYLNIEKIDWDTKTPKKCVITYKKAKFDYYQTVPRPIPRHIEEAVYKQYGSQKEGYDQNSNYNKNPTNPGLYNGPYVVSELKLGSHITFAPNPNFYGKKPNIKKVIVKYIPNTGTLEANLMSGTIDMICSLGLTFDQALGFEEKIQKQNLPFNIHFQAGTTYEHLDVNLDNPILKDVRVRKALVHAIDRQLLVKSLFKGKQAAAIHNPAPLDPNYTEDKTKISLYPFDKKEAGRLLQESGWSLNEKDGYRYKDGQKLSLQLMTTAGNKNREQVQTMLQGQWKSVGVEIIIKNEPARVFFGDTMKERKYSGLAMYAWTSVPDQSSRSTLHTENIPTKEKSWSGQNYPGWSNKTTDKLLEQFETEFLPEKRKAITMKILKEYTADIPVIPLYYRSEIAVTPKTMTGFKLTGHLFHDTNSIEDWNIGTSMK